MDLAQTLKDFRQANGLEQDDLANLLDTTQQTISNWESGTMPRSAALNRINHLLKTYKKGEELQPWVAPRYHPAITEIHEIPVDKDAQRAKLDAMRERGVLYYGEHHTKRSVAENLEKVASELTPTIGVQIERQFIDEIPDDLKQNCRRKIAVHGHMYRFVYCSDKVVAELGVLIPRTVSGGVLHIPTTGLSRTLWRMSSHRLMTKEVNPDRKYFLFLSMINDTGGPLPMQAITRLTGEAALHGISVIWTDSKNAADYLAAVERGQLRTLTMREDEDEDD